MGIGTIKQSKLIKFIEANGFYKDRQQESHVTYRNDILRTSVVIPVEKKDAHDYLVLKVRKALKLTYEEFLKELKKLLSVRDTGNFAPVRDTKKSRPRSTESLEANGLQ